MDFWAVIVYGFVGYWVVKIIFNQIDFKREQKEFNETLETAPLKELKRMYNNFYRNFGSPYERKALLERIEQLENKESDSQ